jgi:hypothetical protein
MKPLKKRRSHSFIQKDSGEIVAGSPGDKYKNYRLLNMHRYSDCREVDRAIKALCKVVDYSGVARQRQMKILVLDLYHCYKGDKSRYIQFYLNPNSYEKIERYNHFSISYRIVREITERLFADGYIEVTKGFRDVKTGKTFASKMKAKDKLIAFLENEHNVRPRMVSTWRDEEIIILKEKTKKEKDKNTGKLVKLKPKIKYDDTLQTKNMRKVVVAYNDFMADTYIDIDIDGYVYKRAVKEKDKENQRKHEPLRIDLSLKRTKRVFNGDFEHGGRFYGAFWQGCPESLRPRITINGEYTVEYDFSGLHIHLLYALCGKKLGNVEPYIVSKGNDPCKLRKIYKLIMLTSVNCGSDVECIVAVQDQLDIEMDEEPDKYPDEVTEEMLYKMLEELKVQHKPIAKFINKKTGTMLQNIDSRIVEAVIVEMTAKRIPVLSIHDSFICTERDKDVVLECMKDSYIKIVESIVSDEHTNFTVTTNEILTTECLDAIKLIQPYRRLTYDSGNRVNITHNVKTNNLNYMLPSKYKLEQQVKFNQRYEADNVPNVSSVLSDSTLLKIIRYKYAFKSDYARRYLDYLFTKETTINEVITLYPQVEYV